LTLVAQRKPKLLIVEGDDDLYTVVELMKAHIGWPKEKKNAPVPIKAAGGVDKILEPGYLPVELRTTGVTLGIVLDADTTPGGRYESIRNLCIGTFPQLPKEMPPDGLITENEDDKRLGLWIMPDNASEGALETFLRFLIPESSPALWELATGSVTAARELGASCRECHIEKANLYTWLAWQDLLDSLAVGR